MNAKKQVILNTLVHSEDDYDINFIRAKGVVSATTHKWLSGGGGYVVMVQYVYPNANERYHFDTELQAERFSKKITE